MRDALAADQIVPYYQPKISMASGRVVGFEALARWLAQSEVYCHPAISAPAQHRDLDYDPAAFEAVALSWPSRSRLNPRSDSISK